MIHEIEQAKHIFVSNTFQKQQRITVLVFFQDIFEERAASRYYYLVSFHLFILACQSYVIEILLFFEVS